MVILAKLGILKAKEPRGIIPLENVRVRATEEKGKPYCFEIYSDNSEVCIYR